MADTKDNARVAKDLLAGTVGGMAQVLSGQPFDIVKVRLQSSNAYAGMLDCASRIAREEGPMAFYKGTTMPLIGVGACVSIQFGLFEAGKRFFLDRNRSSGQPDVLTFGQLYLAGAGAGVGNSVVSGPVEHIRIRLQTQRTSVPSEPLPAGATTASNPALSQTTKPAPTTPPTTHYKGPGDALRKIYQADGLKGIYKGQTATMLREFHGYGIYFLTYEYLVQRQCRSQGCSRKDISPVNAVAYGAAAGWAMWLTSYPLDVIKTCLQTDGFSSQPSTKKYNGFVDCAVKLWKKDGVKAFTRGLGPTLIRSPFVNGATFLGFEMTMRALN